MVELDKTKYSETYTFESETAGTAYYRKTQEGGISFDGTVNPGYVPQISPDAPFVEIRKLQPEPDLGAIQLIQPNDITINQELKPWNKIPDEGKNRQMLKLWWDGNTAGEIGIRLDMREKTVRNKLSDLRKIFGVEIIPKHRK